MSTLRYPGVRPFETRERHMFFGRARDIADLYDLVLLEKLLVLFGKSGYGKSSLLKAGIVPLFTELAADAAGQYHPLEIRFGSYQAGKSPTPLAATLAVLEKELPACAEAGFLDPFFKEKNSLWYQCKRRQTPQGGRLLMIFDQFEEFFTYPRVDQIAFRTQLAEALYEATPQNIRAASAGLSPEARKFLAAPFDLKVVFSIRADRLSLLDGMKDRLPAILNKRYELKALDEKQARSAIVRPALLSADEGDFATPPFGFTDAALNEIIAKLSTEKGERIEAFQLQVVCQYLERQVQQGQIADRDGDGQADITPDDLPNFDTVYEDYYRSKLAELSPAEARAARIVVEEGLLFVNEVTGESRRLSKDPGELVQNHGRAGVNAGLLQKLESTYLLRREANSVGVYHYEISHDTLIAPITKSRQARRNEDIRRSASRRTRQALVIAAVALLLMAGAIVAALWALDARDKARNAEEKAKQSLQRFVQEQAARERLEFQRKRQEAIDFAALGTAYCPLVWARLSDMDSIARRQPELTEDLEELRQFLLKKCPDH